MSIREVSKLLEGDFYLVVNDETIFISHQMRCTNFRFQLWTENCI